MITFVEFGNNLCIPNYIDYVFAIWLELSVSKLESDFEIVTILHAEPLVMKLKIVNAMVSRVLVDGGNSFDIIFWKDFQRMGIYENLI